MIEKWIGYGTIDRAVRVAIVGAVAAGLISCEARSHADVRQAEAHAEQIALAARQDRARALEAERSNAEAHGATATATAQPIDRIALKYLASNDAAKRVGVGRICRAAIATVMGQSPNIIRARTAADATTDKGMTVRTRYTRPSDGTVWRNECSVAGNRVLWAVVDADGAVGRKRLEDQLYYSAQGSSITIKHDMDGERVSEKTYVIR